MAPENYHERPTMKPDGIITSTRSLSLGRLKELGTGPNTKKVTMASQIRLLVALILELPLFANLCGVFFAA